MSKSSRYEIIESIAQGDFATVYRGMDNELSREVAIKQIHHQYLADPSKLDRYWKEAQLLAKMEHPYIMTIYDLVRDRGWLILELMQGNLEQQLNGKPIDLEDLRLTIIYMCHALKYMEDNGIVHGDVKPSNLLLDKNHRVKLGDFGIARRLTSDDGSVVKGNTKYMAPEVLSDQFGDVGPQSDLYSLGFSAYSLMCGHHFESLFPGLNMYGRDPQIAWMMWHGAMDRRLPEISRVLDGVPPDLAHVIQKLTQKDPAERYHSADEVIQDLKTGMSGHDIEAVNAEKVKLQQEEKKKAKKKRMMLYGLLAASMLMTIGMLFIPTGSKELPSAGIDLPESGTIHLVALDRNEIYILPEGANKSDVVEFSPDVDEIFLDDVKSSLDALQEGFLVSKIEASYDRDGNLVKKIITAVSRKTTTVEGLLASVNTATGMVRIEPGGESPPGQSELDDENPGDDDDDPAESEPLQVYVPSTAVIQLNGVTEQLGSPLSLKILREGDLVSIEYQDDKDRLEAISVSAKRLVSLTGALVSMDPAKRTISLSNVEPANEQRESYELSDDSVFSLNDLEFYSSGKKVTLADLRAGDAISIEMDSLVHAVSAERQFNDGGIVRKVDTGNRTIDVFLDRSSKVVPFRLDDNCSIVLKSDSQVRPLQFVRVGDRVELTHDSPDSINASTQKIEVSPAAKRDLWAIVVGIGALADNRLTKPKTASADAQLVQETLTGYYRVPEDQLLLLLDPNNVQLRQQVEDFVSRVPQNGQLVVYLAGLGFITDAGQAVLATNEFSQNRIAQSGFPLREWIDLLEASPSQETLLLLDCYPLNSRGGGLKPVSAVELVESLMPSPGKPISTSVTVITSSGKNERQGLLADQSNGLFAAALSNAVEGAADRDGDHLVTAKELASFVDSEMNSLAKSGQAPQTSSIYYPDASPDRLNPETRRAVFEILSYVDTPRWKNEYATRYESAKRLQPDEPDVDLAYGLVCLKHNRTVEFRKVYEKVQLEHPDSLLTYQCLGWWEFRSNNNLEGIEQLQQLLTHATDLSTGVEQKYVESAVITAGQLRNYGLKVASPPLQIGDTKNLDQIAMNRGDPITSWFRTGIDQVQAKIKAFQTQYDAAEDETQRQRVERQRGVLSGYSDLDYDQIVDYLTEKARQ